jgi:dimeric dUTPase (all-alpha-NTP-PPase superfamily)
MNLRKLYEIQAELDERIVEKHNLQGQDLLPKKILALQVELGELANEWRGFKFWSKNQEPRTRVIPKVIKAGEPLYKNPLLEEYVDCLHFILSIGLDKGWGSGIEIMEPLPKVVTNKVTSQFNLLFRKIGDFYSFNTYMNYRWIINLFIALGEMLGFSWEEIEAEYLRKNEINHTRQNNNY